jgi:hypothetical protein
VALDLTGPYPLTPRGKRILLMATDLFYWWTEAFPVPNSTIGVITPPLEHDIFVNHPHRQRAAVPRPSMDGRMRRMRRRGLGHAGLSTSGESH